MFIHLGADAYVNVAHISLLSPVQRDADSYHVSVLLMGRHTHVATGTEQEMKQLHARLKSGIDQLEAPLSHG